MTRPGGPSFGRGDVTRGCLWVVVGVAVVVAGALAFLLNAGLRMS